MKLALKTPRMSASLRTTSGEGKRYQLMKRRQKNTRGIIKIILVWLIFIGYINIISPSSLISFVGFYLLLALSLFSTFRLFISLGRAIIWLAIILIYLLLRQFRLDNLINTILLFGLLFTLEIYFRRG